MGTITIKRKNIKTILKDDKTEIGSIANYIITDPFGEKFHFDNVYVETGYEEAFLVVPSTNEEVKISHLHSKSKKVKSAFG